MFLRYKKLTLTLNDIITNKRTVNSIQKIYEHKKIMLKMLTSYVIFDFKI